MKFSVLFLIFGALISVSALAKGKKPEGCVKTLGSLSVDFLRDNVFSSEASESQRQRTRTAVQVNGFKKVAINLQIFENHSSQYTNTLESSAIADQKQSGRCWSFAACKTLRDSLVRQKIVLPAFEFSTAHQHFFNMLEKSNSYLNRVIGISARGSVDSSQEKTRKNLDPASRIVDGGWFEYFGFIVQKYGLVPKQVMPETVSSENTTVLLEELRAHAARVAQKILDTADELRGPRGKLSEQSIAKLHKIRENGMLEIIEILRTHLGTPPGVAGKANMFQWRNSDGSVTEFTPQSFARDFAKFDPKEYVAISNFDSHPQNTLIEIKNSAIGVGDRSFNIKMINTSAKRMLELTTASIDQNQSVWFAAAMGKDVDMETGIMMPGMYSNQETYGFSDTRSLSRQEKTALGILALNHAMVIDGYDQPDKNQPVIKLRVANSWGKGNGDRKMGDQGVFHMYLPWFEQNVFSIIVHKSLLSPKELALWASPSTKINGEDLY